MAATDTLVVAAMVTQMATQTEVTVATAGLPTATEVGALTVEEALEVLVVIKCPILELA